MITTTTISERYTPSTPTTVYPFNIRYFEDTDINIDYENSLGIKTSLVLNTDFTVDSVNGNPENGCTITTTVLYTIGDTLTIYREVPVTQEAEFIRGGDMPPEVLNTSLDRSVAVSQQLIDSSIRAIVGPITDPDGLNYELPTVLNRKNKAVGFDENGNAISLDLSDSGAIAANNSEGIELSNNIISAKVDNYTTEFNYQGNIAIKNGGVNANRLADNAVVTTKITNNAVTEAKIIDGAVSFDKLSCVLDEDTLVSNSDTDLATQQSIKAYIDSFKPNVAYLKDGAVQYFTSQTVIPGDDTIPQSNEGSEVMTLAFTPTKADSRIKVEVRAYFAHSGGDSCTAMFVDAETSAVATAYTNDSSNLAHHGDITYIVDAVNTSARTFKVRIGGNSTTTTFNGDNSNAPKYGATIASTITITEIYA